MNPPPPPPPPAPMVDAMWQSGHLGEGIYPPISPANVCPYHSSRHRCCYPYQSRYTHDSYKLCHLEEVCTNKDFLNPANTMCDAPHHARPTCCTIKQLGTTCDGIGACAFGHGEWRPDQRAA